jgi:transcriptional regulator with XRE-family HTH domain
MEPERFRKYLPAEKRYVGWMSNRRMTRKAFAAASGVPVVTLKQIELHNVTPRPATLAKIEALQKLIGADRQQEILDGRATRAAEKAAAKLAAKAEAALDAMLDRAMRAARKPLKKSARQGGLF